MKKPLAKIIDTHAHILTRFVGADNIEKYAMSALEDEVIVINATMTLNSISDALEIHKKYPWIIPTAGVHGLFVSEFKDGDVEEIDEIIDDRIIAIGAVGLDYPDFTLLEQKRKQSSIFVSQIRMARRHDLPVIVHTRNSARENLELITQYPDIKFIIHCWEGDEEQTKELLKASKNIWFGFGGKITQKNKEVSDHIKETIKLIPQNRILLESDAPSPDTLPQTIINKGITENTPGNIRETMKWIAKFLKVKQDEFLDKCNQNAIEVFSLPKDILERDFKEELGEVEK